MSDSPVFNRSSSRNRRRFNLSLPRAQVVLQRIDDMPDIMALDHQELNQRKSLIFYLFK
ncbi:hypothetical protein [Neodiprion sertifer nucleopolyhedrovirus]|uniref:Uncharacterized protein n=1 Tax=Neodiprion sertifer nucleopolyhedrovirus TaxID=111874 RepID=Q6JKE6_9CBAC|nr:hypothetical protein NeseNPV_gp14 [Neodiprion sertifer nucleopolyhedrovirus]AAQ96391.1 hypothetical protein [Neodiprion sertifer nucleopolyhedrovirus]